MNAKGRSESILRKRAAPAHEPLSYSPVMPANSLPARRRWAGIQERGGAAGAGMDSRFRGSDGAVSTSLSRWAEGCR
jgi:hypothetical protein